VKIFFPVLNWGLGHASRSLPLIKSYLQSNHQVICASDGEALAMLRKELPDQTVLELPGYNIQYDSTYMPINMLRYGPGMLRTIKAEHELTKAIVARHQIDCIISDNRYGCYHADVPSALITHQLQVFTGQKLMDVYIRRQIRSWFKKFTEIWIPDQTPPRNLTGDLSGLDTAPIPKYYLGIISELSCLASRGKYKAVAIISGPEPQRTNFDELVTKQLSELPGDFAIVRGRPGIDDPIRKEGNLTIFPYLNRAALSNILAQTNLVISRSGYTTLMDLAYTGHKAILCPTPGQYEQIYLADRLSRYKQCIYQRQENLDLESAFEELESINPIGFGTAPEIASFEERLFQLANIRMELVGVKVMP
jgi:UDP:flavonoid glycosyltransferase YjiC (YdhE family)